MSSTSLTDNPYGAECNPDKAPEAISKAVASLPPEQMFELMKQMKHCIQNNPNEARNMLLQNPQLAYALLQAQVVMNIVDPQVALTMLHRPNAALQPLMPATESSDAQVPLKTSISNIIKSSIPPLPDLTFKGPNVVNLPLVGLRPNVPSRSEEFLRGPVSGGFIDPRSQQFEPRDPRNLNFDARMRPPMMRAPMMMPPLREPVRDMARVDPRALPHEMDIRPPLFDPRLRGIDPRVLRGPPPPDFDQRGMGLSMRPRFPDRGNFESGSPIYDQRDPRNQPMRPPRPGGQPLANPTPALQISGQGQDQEKAALIMQVLQLSDQQIALLPPEQRQSIMVLKEQIAKSAENQK